MAGLLAATAAPLAAKGPWQVDRAPDGCLMVRSFVDGEGEAVLAWRALPLEESVEIVVSRKGGMDGVRVGWAVVTTSLGGRDRTIFERSPGAAPGTSVTRLRVLKALFDNPGERVTMTIEPDKAPSLAFALDKPLNAFAALAACQEEMLKGWGVDPGERARVAQPPEGAPGDWIAVSDYPRKALREGRQGTSVFLFRIGTAGTVDLCRTVVSSGTPALDEAACSAMMRRGRFVPARDAQGRPVAVHRVHRIRWQLPN